MLRKLSAPTCMFIAGILAWPAAFASDAEIIGAGASFPAPVIQAWAGQFSRENKIDLRYRSVGSGEGIRRLTARTTDFAMTDVPLTRAELDQDDLLQFPLVVGAIVPVVNVAGVRAGDMRLTGEVLADVFLGKITKWNDPAIGNLNPGLSLPELPVKVVHRADGSGTSFVFTHYLTKVSTEWNSRLGTGSRLRWPAGSGAKGNEGVAETVRATAGAIGYVEYSYALKYQLATVQLANKTGVYVQPAEAAIRAAMRSANWTRPSYYEMLTNRDGENSWPIIGVSYALIHKQQSDHTDAEETLSFFDWVYRRGAQLALALNYVSIEDPALIQRIETSWRNVKDENGRVVWKGR